MKKYMLLAVVGFVGFFIGCKGSMGEKVLEGGTADFSARGNGLDGGTQSECGDLTSDSFHAQSTTRRPEAPDRPYIYNIHKDQNELKVVDPFFWSGYYVNTNRVLSINERCVSVSRQAESSCAAVDLKGYRAQLDIMRKNAQEQLSIESDPAVQAQVQRALKVIGCVY
jgi:hypothetical protein